MAPRAADSAQLALIHTDQPSESGKTGRRKTGRHERALNRAVESEPGLKLPVMAAAVSLARSIAAALDRAETSADPYATSQLSAQYRESLRALQLLPDARAGGESHVADPLSFGEPE